MADEMVMVGCKHPNGVTLNLDTMIRIGGETSLNTRRVPGKATVTLKGWSHAFNKPDPGETTGGYVLTAVPLAFWEEWLASHGDFPMILDKTILGPHRDPVRQAVGHAKVDKMFAPSMGELTAAKLTQKD